MTETRIVGAEPWKETIFGCCSDLSTCCYGCFCTPCLFGENVSKTSKDSGCFPSCCGYCLTRPGCCCFIHKPARIHFREAYGLQEDQGCGSDLCGAWCCSVCGVCQEAREMKARGPPPMVTIVSHAGPPPSTIRNQP